MILDKIKIWAVIGLGFVSAIFGLKHYRDKSKRLQQALEVNHEINKIEKGIREEQKKAKRDGDKELKQALDNAKSKRDHFS